MICAGGNYATSNLERYSFELDAWTIHTFSETGLPARRFVSSITVKKKLYFFAGTDVAASEETSDIYQFDADTTTASQIGNLSQPWSRLVLILTNILEEEQ